MPRPGGARATQPPAPSGDDAASHYVSGRAIRCRCSVWRNPELTTTITVRPMERFRRRSSKDMVAVGKTPHSWARDMEKVLAEYIRSPKVNVIVSQPMSALSQSRSSARWQAASIRIGGIKVLDAVSPWEGFGQFAAGNRAKIVRSVNHKKQEIRVKLDDLNNKGDMSQNLALQPGDVLVVPESRF